MGRPLTRRPLRLVLGIALPLTLLLLSCDAPPSQERPSAPGDALARPGARIPSALELPPCTNPGDPVAEALEPVTGPAEGRITLPSGRAVTPWGETTATAAWPLNGVLSSDGRYLYTSNADPVRPRVQQIDLSTGQVVANPSFRRLFHGLALDEARGRLYVSGGEDQVIHVLSVGAPGLSEVATWSVTGYPADLKLSPDGARIYVAGNLGRTLMELDAESGELLRTLPLDLFPYQMALSQDGKAAYVTQSSEASVSVVDLETGRVSRTLSTANNPAGLILSPDGERLYVTAANGDKVEAFNTRTGRREASQEVGIYREGLHGVSPNSLALSASGDLLYVANAGDNAVEVLRAATLDPIGAIPTAWYPSALALTPDGATLVVLNGKGKGATASLNGDEASDLMPGTLQRVGLPLPTELLEEGHAQVVQNNRRPLTLHEISCQGKMFPIPSEGSESPIEHVVLIVRENKTYDAYLGDLEVGDGDPDLVLFGEEVTPNTHALARQFTVFDNFYTDAEDSDQGHLWLTGAMVSDFSERVNAAKRTQLTGVSKDADLETHYIFNQMMRAGRSWVNYGEVVGLEVATMHGIDLDFPGYFYNMMVKDEEKARYVASRIEAGVMPEFTYLLLPNDHTNGTSPGKLSPESMVSDNDYGVGIVVDAISKSQFWPTTAIFILEDDPQSGSDHVEAHRSPAVVVSPWAKRNYVSSVHYSIPSILRTIGLILDVPPMTQYDAMAIPMYDAFTAVPDYAPYDALPRQIPDTYNTEATVGAALSARMDFSGPDRAKGLADVIWRYRKGTEPPPQLGLKADDDDGDEDDDADEGVGEGWEGEAWWQN